MKPFKLSSIFFVLLAFSVALMGPEIFGQGKGKGGGGGPKHGVGGQTHGGTPKADTGNRGGKGNGRVQAPSQSVISNPGWQGRGNDRQAQGAAPVIRQADRAWQGRGIDRPAQVQPQIMRQPDMRGNGRGRGQSQREQIRMWQNARQPEIVPQQKSRGWNPQVFEQRRLGRENRRDREGRNVYVPRQQTFGLPENYGQQRKREVHQRNAERKALKEESKALKRAWRDNRQLEPNVYQSWPQQRYAPSYDDRYGGYQRPYSYRAEPYPYSSYEYPQTYQQSYGYQPQYSPLYVQPYYGAPTYGQYYSYAQPRLSGGDILRNLIFSVLAGSLGGSEYYEQTSGYLPIGYYDDRYYGNTPQYIGYSSAPYYSGYGEMDPFIAGTYYNDPYVTEALPVQYFASSSPGSGLFRQIFAEMLALGYDQGYNDGLAARRIRERDRVFYDPYAYDDELYDPYSVSLGDNRRCLSQGYELGYMDAVNNVRGYDRFQNANLDLVSVLIGTVSQLI